jgi:hypothetical protein
MLSSVLHSDCTRFSRTLGLFTGSVSNIVMSNLEVSNHGQHGIALNGKNSVITNVEVKGTGCSAVKLSGGSTYTLAASNIKVFFRLSFCVCFFEVTYHEMMTIMTSIVMWQMTHSAVHDYARIKRTYHPGVSFSGVGITVERKCHTGAAVVYEGGVWRAGVSCPCSLNIGEELRKTFIQS